jgi:hypothetical protein
MAWRKQGNFEEKKRQGQLKKKNRQGGMVSKTRNYDNPVEEGKII